MTRPAPWQWGQVWAKLKTPREEITWPRPPQVEQVRTLEPASAPVPWHSLQRSGLARVISLLRPADGLLEGDLHVVAEVPAPVRLGCVGGPSAEEVFEEAAPAEDLAEDFKRIVEAAGAGISAGAAVEGGVAVLIVSGPLLGVVEHFVCFAQFLELLFGGFVSRVLVRVMLEGQFPVSLLDFVRTAVFCDSQDFVIVAFGHGSGGRLFGHDHGGGPEKAFAQTIAFAELLHDMALGGVLGFLLGNRLVQLGVEGLSKGVDLFESAVLEGILELLVNHVDAGLEGLDCLLRGRLGGGQGHIEAVQHRDQLLQHGLVGVAGGLLLFPSGAFLVIVKVRRRAQEPFPVLFGFCGAFFQVLELLRSYGGYSDRDQRFRRFGRRGGRRLCIFHVNMFHGAEIPQASRS